MCFTDLYCTFPCILFCSPFFFFFFPLPGISWQHIWGMNFWKNDLPLCLHFSGHTKICKVLDGSSKLGHLSCKISDLHHQCIWKHKNASANLEEWKDMTQLFIRDVRENKCIIPFYMTHKNTHCCHILKYCPLKIHLLITSMGNKPHRNRADTKREFPELNSLLWYVLKCIINTFVKQGFFRSWLHIPGVYLVWLPAGYTHKNS